MTAKAAQAFEDRIEDMKQNAIRYELKLLRELEEAVRNHRPVQPMLIGLDRLRKLAEKPADPEPSQDAVQGHQELR